MKTKNTGSIEKYWADQKKKADKAASQPKAAPKKKSRANAKVAPK